MKFFSLLSKRCILPAFLLLLSSNAHATPLKITTWNMEWLTLKHEGDPALPDDVKTRTESDFQVLHQAAQKLHSDIIAFQEVDGEDAVGKVFSPSEYHLILTHDPIVQNVGLAIRKDISYTVNPELKALNIQTSHSHHPLRTGLDVTLYYNNSTLRVLVVHLKTGCWAQPLEQTKHSCPILYQQFKVIENWILDREDEKIPYIILGDFNRRLTLKDPVMLSLKQEDSSLDLTTSGFISPCEDGRRFIDHILLGNGAEKYLVPNSLLVMTYKNLPKNAYLSDHCPVSVFLQL